MVLFSNVSAFFPPVTISFHFAPGKNNTKRDPWLEHKSCIDFSMYILCWYLSTLICAHYMKILYVQSLFNSPNLKNPDTNIFKNTLYATKFIKSPLVLPSSYSIICVLHGVYASPQALYKLERGSSAYMWSITRGMLQATAKEFTWQPAWCTTWLAWIHDLPLAITV